VSVRKGSPDAHPHSTIVRSRDLGMPAAHDTTELRWFGAGPLPRQVRVWFSSVAEATELGATATCWIRVPMWASKSEAARRWSSK
jgi:hypothetical protein